jgi:hypothetical protein
LHLRYDLTQYGHYRPDGQELFRPHLVLDLAQQMFLPLKMVKDSPERTFNAFQGFLNANEIAHGVKTTTVAPFGRNWPVVVPLLVLNGTLTAGARAFPLASSGVMVMLPAPAATVTLGIKPTGDSAPVRLVD